MFIPACSVQIVIKITLLTFDIWFWQLTFYIQLVDQWTDGPMDQWNQWTNDSQGGNMYLWPAHTFSWFRWTKKMSTVDSASKIVTQSVPGWAVSLTCALAPYEISMALLKPPKGPVWAPKGLFRGPGGPWTVPGGQIWSELPLIGPTEWLPHTLTWNWAFLWLWYCGIAWYCMVVHCIEWYLVVLVIIWYCMLLHGIAWYGMVLQFVCYIPLFLSLLIYQQMWWLLLQNSFSFGL